MTIHNDGIEKKMISKTLEHFSHCLTSLINRQLSFDSRHLFCKTRLLIQRQSVFASTMTRQSTLFLRVFATFVFFSNSTVSREKIKDFVSLQDHTEWQEWKRAHGMYFDVIEM